MRWEDIQGWFDFQDVYKDQVASAGDTAHFVEVGGWLGKSSVFMADRIRESGKQIRFDVVDTFRGSPTANDTIQESLALAEAGTVYPQFMDNIRACGVDDIIHAIVGDSAETAAQYADESLDFVFIDADHTLEAVRKDITAYWPKIKPGGVLGGHDYDEYGPHFAACEFVDRTGAAISVNHRSFIIRKPLRQDNECIFLALPSYGNLDSQMAMAGICAPTASKHRVEIQNKESSLLATSFNSLWCKAISDPRYTHFAMLHADIAPQNWWLDVLMEELKRSGADMISVVSPIKDDRGVTSTGIANLDNPWSPMKRFTMKEIMDLPETFDAAQAGYPDNTLLINTGCWLADIRNPKWRLIDDKGDLVCYFTTKDRVHKHEGQYVCYAQSEDWFFSQQLHIAGLKAVATRKVSLVHYGRFGFPNNAKWGGWTTDEETKCFWEAQPPMARPNLIAVGET